MNRKPYNKFSLLGWSDVAAGQPYPPAYDGWDELEQRNYENGRMRAVNYRAATGKLPKRSVDKDTYNAAARLVGAAFWSKEDPNRLRSYYEGPRQHAGVAR